MIVFSVHPHGYQKQCTDDPLGTYIANVPYFVDGYIRDYALEMYEQGKDYEYPDAYQYVSCTPITIQNTQYYFQLGCADDNNQKLAVNIYSDKSCTKRSYVDGSDDSTIDVSKLQVSDKDNVPLLFQARNPSYYYYYYGLTCPWFVTAVSHEKVPSLRQLVRLGY